MNCTIACKSHGFRYTILIMGLCSCSSYLAIRPPLVWTSGSKTPVVITDNLIAPTPPAGGVWNSPIGANSACTNAFRGPPNIYCYGDRSQPQCGWRVGQYYGTFGNGGLQPAQEDYNTTQYNGQYAHAAYIDYSFQIPSTYNISTEQYKYNYLGCFTNPTVITNAMVPYGFNNTLTFQNCLLSCSMTFMAYAGMTANTDGSVPNFHREAVSV